MNINYIHPADQLVMFMQRIYDKGMTTTSGGNLSILDEEGNIWITPAGVDKGTLNRNDIVCVKPDGTTVGMHRPSSELPFISTQRPVESKISVITDSERIFLARASSLARTFWVPSAVTRLIFSAPQAVFS